MLPRAAWIVLAGALPLVFVASGVVRAQNRVEFALTDQPGRWFDNEAGPVAGSRSLAVATPGVEVRFSGRSHTVHTMSSLLWPAGAAGMPFDTRAMKGSAEVVSASAGIVRVRLQGPSVHARGRDRGRRPHGRA
jgi:hypothetical protein